MQIDKSMILDLIKEQAGAGKASQAQQELPDQIDPQRDAGLLQKFGVDPQDLVMKFANGGGIGGLLGGS